jgi:hypothetical protein
MAALSLLAPGTPTILLKDLERLKIGGSVVLIQWTELNRCFLLITALRPVRHCPTLQGAEYCGRGGGSMARITLIVRHSRNGGCPAAHAVDGPLKLATGEVVNDAQDERMVLIQGYELDDSGALAQFHLDPGENALAVQESLILSAADEIRARR